MRYRRLGRTTWEVSEVGFGTIPILAGSVDILPRYFNLSAREADSLLEGSLDKGCNLYDTARVPEYGDAELKVGAFARRHRAEIIVGSKAKAFGGREMATAVEGSLRTLGLDRCDIYFVHQVAPENAAMVFDEEVGAVAELVRRRSVGDVGAVGIATHHYRVALLAARDPRVDVIQVPGNVLEIGILKRVSLEPAFGRVGILVHKVLAAGMLPRFFPIAELLGGVLSYPIAAALVGLGTANEVMAAMNSNLGECRSPVDGQFERVVATLQSVIPIIPCDRCQECACPAAIEVANLIRYYNYYHLGHRAWASGQIRRELSALESCRACPECRVVCTSHGIDIRDVLRAARSLVECEE
jgi:uncharacterized protein